MVAAAVVRGAIARRSAAIPLNWLFRIDATSTMGSGSLANDSDTWLCLALLTGIRIDDTAIDRRSRSAGSASNAFTNFRRHTSCARLEADHHRSGFMIAGISAASRARYSPGFDR